MPPPERRDHVVVWYRVPLPALADESQALFLPGVYQLVHVYVGGRQLLQFGDFDDRSAVKILGSPFHIVPLTSDMGGQYLYLRIFSEFKNIGLLGPAYVGPPAEHVKRVVHNDFPRVALGCLFIFIGFFQVFLFRRRVNVAEYAAFGSFLVLYGLHSVARTTMKQLIVDTPLVWKYIEILTILILPVGLLVFVERVFAAGYKNLVRRLWQINLAVVIVVLPMSLGNAGLLELGLAWYHPLFVPGCALLLGATALAAWKGDRDAAIFFGGLICLAVPGAIDGLTVGGQIPWIDPVSPYGCFGFMLALQWILSRRLAAERHQKFLLERELETAAIFSSTFLPPASARRANDFGLEVVFKPAAQLGGDWFAYYLYKERYLHVHIGDVTGHGPASALLAAFAKGATDMLYSKLEADNSQTVPIDQLHQNLNSLLSGTSEAKAFMTLFSIAIDLTTGKMEYINSGHLFQFVCSTTSLRNAVLTGNGRSLLGANRQLKVMKPDKLALGGDEMIFLFSDGLVELLGRDAARGMKQFFEMLKGSAHLPVETVRDQITALVNEHGDRRGDDITFIVVKIGPQAPLAKLGTHT